MAPHKKALPFGQKKAGQQTFALKNRPPCRADKKGEPAGSPLCYPVYFLDRALAFRCRSFLWHLRAKSMPRATKGL